MLSALQGAFEGVTLEASNEASLKAIGALYVHAGEF